MTQKLLLAESLDLLRQCEQREYDVDRTKLRISSSNRYRNELGRLLQSYDTVYQQYVRGIHILNYVRHTALADSSPQRAQYTKNLSEFCAGKITAAMVRCNNILRKMDAILLPIEQVDHITKEGYAPEDTIYLQDGITYPLSRKERVMAKEFTLTAGTYVLALKNRDDYTLAAPGVDVTLVVLPQRGSGLEPSRVEVKLPCQCGWRKVIGVVDASTVQLEIRHSGIRDAHVDVVFQKWCAIEDIDRPSGAASGHGSVVSPSTCDSGDYNTTCKSAAGHHPKSKMGGNGGAATPARQQPKWMGQLPRLPDDELASLASYNAPATGLPTASNLGLSGSGGTVPVAPSAVEDPWATLASLNVPNAPTTRGAPNAASVMSVPDPVEANPPGMTCRQRLDRIHQLMNVWPSSGVTACALQAESQCFIQSVYTLPFPRELSA
ncbi:hypothetical protein LSCM1_08001 [Leishmania martiniquensis]|uniref:Uncharacterized protein n=1 Tax=Leishmania martiniquensis TaxID=1580590 RepID=A0A836I1Q0_9TRYP|nr:hypothetical protein LSCM1_08001 [Leishmania martiniquensis]